MGSPRTDDFSFMNRRKTHNTNAVPKDPIGVSVELLDDLNTHNNLNHASSKKSLHSNSKKKSYLPPNEINRKIHTHRAGAGSHLLPKNAPQNSLLLGPL